MINITLLLIGIIVLFAIFIPLRSIFSLKICALCGAVSMTWITLLVLLYLNYEVNPVLIGLLMGGSVVGTIHLFEQKLPEKYRLFKLPFFLTLISLAYFVIEQAVIISTITVIILIWSLAVIVHISRQEKGVKILWQKIIKCCKNW